MALIKPFQAVRPAQGLESLIAALPYDVYNRSEAKEVVSKNAKTFLKIDRAETTLPDDVDTYDPRVYAKARQLYEEMLGKGEFVKDNKPCYYLYEETMNGRAQTGLVCAASVRDYENGVIKKHENTRADKEVDRINHVDTVDAQTGPIFLAYRNDEKLNAFLENIKTLEKPYFDFVSDDGIRHRGFKIDSDDEIKFITDSFAKIPNLYIADGHHRCASAAKVSIKRREEATTVDENAEYNFFLSVVFPDSELMIMDYNRVVKDLNGLSEEEFIARVSEKFDVRSIAVSDNKPAHKGDIYMLLKGKEYCISLKDEYVSDDPIKALDVSKLQDYLLNPILGIENPKTDKRIDFVGGIRGVKELWRRLETDSTVAFAMYPTLMSELFAVADAGLLMPPKSTWFEPKLRSGLFIHELQ
ncbi:MAG: DUF1015 domain-containing protein [Lachnospiraceae bacterium]|nr:DUF1015 domain-containing protein [Lachnospiraceae bacterium]